ncbi:MAG: ATP-binding protein [Planctomycetota bacterium]|nr:ATP-binding protein [Planctomycetota bacterium]
MEVLLIEDNYADAMSVREMLKDSPHHSYDVTTASRLDDGLELLAKKKPEVILLDLTLPDSDGLATLTKILSQTANTPVVVLTGVDNQRFANKAVIAGAQDSLIKGQINSHGLDQCLRYAIERQRQRTKLEMYADILETNEANIRSIIESSTDGMVVLDSRKRVVYANPAAEDLFEQTLDELSGENLSLPIVPGESIEHEIAVGDRIRIVSVSTAGIYWKRATAHLATLHDITSLKQAEARMSRIAVELSRTTTDMEELVYALSEDVDDLLSSAAERLTRATELSGELRPEGTELLQGASADVQRISELVGSLLTYSQICATPKVNQDVDLNHVLEQIGRNLDAEIQESSATIEYAELPTIQGDLGLLTQLFERLIENSIRFRGDAAPQITITCEELRGLDEITPKLTSYSDQRSSGWFFSVTDNGRGIPAEGSDSVFNLFERLHYDEPSGSGIGLSIAKKVVERHGGEIWIDRRQIEGCTVCIALSD